MTRPRRRTFARRSWPGALAVAVAALVGCESRGIWVTPRFSLERMLEQNRFEPFEPNPFFADGAAMRHPPAGAVPRGIEKSEVRTGMSKGVFLTRPPMPVTRALLSRGRERFEIFCAPCHGIAGTGESFVSEKMQLVRPPSLHQPRLRDLPIGALFRVVREGYGLMPSYEADVPLADRWAIVAYVRVLQNSQEMALDALPPHIQREAREALR